MLNAFERFDKEQYQADAIGSKAAPLERRLLPGFMEVGIEIEVFALPGFDSDPKRYLLSQTGAALAVKRGESSIRSFLDSAGFKTLYRNASKFAICIASFYVENSKTPIVGIPGWFATEYWHQQDKKGNKDAEAIIRLLLETKLDDLASDAFELSRTAQERVKNFVTTWQIIRNECRKGHKIIRRMVMRNEYERYYQNHYRYGNKDSAFARRVVCHMTDEIMMSYHAGVVYRVCGFSPREIYQELLAQGENVDKNNLRDWYNTELLEGINDIQQATIKELEFTNDTMKDMECAYVFSNHGKIYWCDDWRKTEADV